MSYLNRESILAAGDLKREAVDVPEWGGTVLISMMTGAGRDAWEQSLIRDGKADTSNIRAKLVAACAVDETGNLLFSPADVAALGAKSGTALERCATAAQRLNGLSDRDVEAAKGN